MVREGGKVGWGGEGEMDESKERGRKGGTLVGVPCHNFFIIYVTACSVETQVCHVKCSLTCAKHHSGPSCTVCLCTHTNKMFYNQKYSLETAYTSLCILNKVL